MNAEHRRPLAAFALVSAAACVILGNGLQSQVSQVLRGADSPAAVVTVAAPDLVLGQSLSSPQQPRLSPTHLGSPTPGDAPADVAAAAVAPLRAAVINLPPARPASDRVVEPAGLRPAPNGSEHSHATGVVARRITPVAAASVEVQPASAQALASALGPDPTPAADLAGQAGPKHLHPKSGPKSASPTQVDPSSHRGAKPTSVKARVRPAPAGDQKSAAHAQRTAHGSGPSKSHAHAAKSHGHAAEGHALAARSHGHAAEGHGHAAKSHGRSAKSHGHAPKSHGRSAKHHKH